MNMPWHFCLAHELASIDCCRNCRCWREPLLESVLKSPGYLIAFWLIFINLEAKSSKTMIRLDDCHSPFLLHSNCLSLFGKTETHMSSVQNLRVHV